LIRRIVLRREARLDLRNARAWYESERAGLGDRFVDAVDDALTAVRDRPASHEEVDPRRGVRRALTRTFPYILYFVVECDTVVVLAVLHAARTPEAWRERK
jgi:plasmid stabilization system protein ParE